MASASEIWLVDFGDPYPGEPAMRRPAVVIGPPGTFGPSFPFIIVCPLMSTPRGLSIHVEVAAGPATGLDADSYIQCELIRSVNRSRLIHRMGSVGPEVNHEVATTVRTLLDL